MRASEQYTKQLVYKQTQTRQFYLLIEAKYKPIKSKSLYGQIDWLTCKIIN